MTPRQRETLQAAILDGIRAAHPGTTQTEIGNAIGQDRSQVSRYGSGERELGLAELVSMVRAYGAVPVIGPIAALDGCRVVACEALPAADPVVSAGAVTGHAVDYLRALLAALRDGRVDAQERDQLLGILRDLVGEAESSAAGLRAVR